MYDTQPCHISFNSAQQDNHVRSRLGDSRPTLSQNYQKRNSKTGTTSYEKHCRWFYTTHMLISEVPTIREHCVHCTKSYLWPYHVWQTDLGIHCMVHFHAHPKLLHGFVLVWEQQLESHHPQGRPLLCSPKMLLSIKIHHYGEEDYSAHEFLFPCCKTLILNFNSHVLHLIFQCMCGIVTVTISVKHI